MIREEERVTEKPNTGSNICYELKSLELGKRTNSYIRVNTRELNKGLFTN